MRCGRQPNPFRPAEVLPGTPTDTAPINRYSLTSASGRAIAGVSGADR